MRHAWIKKDIYKGEIMDVCKKCGIVRRTDRKNKPCKGIVKITLRKGE